MKNKIKKISKAISIKMAGVMIVVASLTSSCNYLSIQSYIDNDLKIDSIFTNERNLEAFMWAVSLYLPDEGAIWAYNYTPGPMAADECITQFHSELPGMRFVTGQVNAETVEGDFGNSYANCYKIIRQCNTILSRMNECQDCLKADNERIMGYTLFFRAYAYYLLVCNFGPVQLVGDEILNNNESVDYYNRPRDLYDDCIEYICTQFESAAQYLPLKQSSSDFGLPTKGAAYGLTARLRLWHASDLYNGGSSAHMYFSTWLRSSDGKNYIQQTPDPKRWAVAAAAAKRVMDMNDNGNPMYKLYTMEANDKTFATRPLSPNTGDPNYLLDFPNGANGIDPYLSYSNIFDCEAIPSINPEIVWGRWSGSVRSSTQYSHPVSNGGWNRLSVPQKIVDAYEMADGRSISNYSADYPYTETGFTTQLSYINSYYHIQANVSNMYVNREPRFYASIGFSGCWWDLSSISDANSRNQTVFYYSDQANGKYSPSDPINHPITGYVLRKYVNPIDSYQGNGSRTVNKAFPMIRYAEILLAYAEALNELGANEYTIDGVTYRRDLSEIEKAFNQVRYRAGLPGVTDSDLNSVDNFREKIKHERMIEFLNENQRYFDVRRWGDYEKSEADPITGMNMEGTQSTFFQRVVPAYQEVSQRKVDRKMIFLPIPADELRRVHAFDQNPGW